MEIYRPKIIDHEYPVTYTFLTRQSELLEIMNLFVLIGDFA